MIQGTPFLCAYYRAMGSEIGSRVALLQGSFFGEADLVHLGDDVVLQGSMQTHLFEDRMMKLGHIQIHKQSRVGVASNVIYSSCIEEKVNLDDLSLAMKGEVLKSNSWYMGAPTERQGPRSSAPSSTTDEKVFNFQSVLQDPWLKNFLESLDKHERQSIV